MTTKLLCHFNGTDGATTVADVVGGVSWTLSNCELDTGRKKFGTAALYSASTADNTAPATKGYKVFLPQSFSLVDRISPYGVVRIVYTADVCAKVPLGHWVRDTEKTPIRILGTGPKKTYPTGFHLFATVEEARIWQRYRGGHAEVKIVLGRRCVARGIQKYAGHKLKVYVCKEIYIPC